jgi:hypothetical protein
MTINLRILSLLALLSFSACSPKIPFTQSLRDQYKLTQEEMRSIQFYLSDPVILRRGSSNSKKETEDGTLVIKNGKNVEQVSFKANTPGALDQVVNSNSLKVSFEDGAEKSLVFASDRNGYYALQAISWDKDGKGTINYGGQTYYAIPGSRNAILLFKMKSLRKVNVQEKVVKGKKIN